LFFGASAGEEPVLSTTEPSGLGSLTNPSRGQKKLFAGKVFVSENEMFSRNFVLECSHENLAENFAFCGGLYFGASFAVVANGFDTRRADYLFADIF